MSPAFQVHNFHGVFVFLFNQPMVTALDEHMDVLDDDPLNVQEFKRAVERKKVNHQSEDGGPLLRSYKFRGPVILHASSEVAIDLNDHLAQYDELPPHLYAFREKLGDRLRYVLQNEQERLIDEAA